MFTETIAEESILKRTCHFMFSENSSNDVLNSERNVNFIHMLTLYCC